MKLINTKPTILNEDYEKVTISQIYLRFNYIILSILILFLSITKAIISNMFALLEWCMSMPLEQLKDHDRATLLRNNFKASKLVIRFVHSPKVLPSKFSFLFVCLFD